jgi:GDP-L-fucose synthase
MASKPSADTTCLSPILASPGSLNPSPVQSPARTVVLVTGGRGLVGSAVRAVVEEAQSAGGSLLWPAAAEFVFASSADADLRDSTATRALFARVRPTHVLHTAGAVGGLFRNMREPVDLGRENILINDSVMESSRTHGCKLITFLSTCIFPDKTSYPIDETMLHDGPPHSSNAAYAHAKRFAEVMTRAYREQHGCRFSCVVPTNIYGPHDNFELANAHVIPALVHKALLAKRDGSKFVVAGSGSPLRQFVHSRDLARLALIALFAYDEAEPLILSVGESQEVSIRRVAELVAAATGLVAAQTVFDESRPDGQHKKTASNAKLLRFLAGRGIEFAFVPVEAGIRETVEWLRDHYDEPQVRR